MGGIQSGTMEWNPQDDTIILETIIYQMGLGTYKQFAVKKKKKNEPVTLEQSLVKSIKDAED